MYCSKCGVQNEEDVNFCKSCGTKLVADEKTNEVETEAVASTGEVKKKSKKKVVGIVIGVIVVLIIIIAIAASEGGERTTDYIGSIRQHRLFRVQGFDATIGTVLNHHIVSPEWTHRRMGDNVHEIEVRGTVYGSNETIVVTIGATFDTERYSITSYSATIGNEMVTGEDAIEFLLILHALHANGEVFILLGNGLSYQR